MVIDNIKDEEAIPITKRHNDLLKPKQLVVDNIKDEEAIPIIKRQTPLPTSHTKSRCRIINSTSRLMENLYCQKTMQKISIWRRTYVDITIQHY